MPLIIGASARAAAFSARRAGLACYAADLFADTDLALLCMTDRVTDYPEGFLEIALQSSANGLIYTGGLENEPDLVDRLAEIIPLWGNEGEVLRRVRNPFLVAEAFSEAGLPHPQILPEDVLPPSNESWLFKPYRSSGGSGVCYANANVHKKGNGFLQKEVEGRPHSALYLSDAGRSYLLGVTEQLIGPAWNAPHPFGYAGSIGPLCLEALVQQKWEKIGKCLVDRFALKGIFGVDAIAEGGEVWPVEVNPRYPSSAEILERAGAPSLIGLHIDACNKSLVVKGEKVPPISGGIRHNRDSPCIGKLIVFAQREVVIGKNIASLVEPMREGSSRPTYADIPCQGERILVGHPVLTFFAEGSNALDVGALLKRRAERVQQALNSD